MGEKIDLDIQDKINLFVQAHFEVFEFILFGAVALVIIFLKMYIQETAKLKALQSQNEVLIDQTEKVKSSYNKELEELRKDHQLDISKRKYQYESKKDHYIRFFQLLDELSKQNTLQTQSRANNLIIEFYRDFMEALNAGNVDKQAEATTVMTSKIQELILESAQVMTRFKQETNTIKVIGSPDLLAKLKQLELLYDKIFDESGKMMINLTQSVISGNSEEITSDNLKIQATGLAIIQVRDEMIEIMREELNQI